MTDEPIDLESLRQSAHDDPRSLPERLDDVGVILDQLVVLTEAARSSSRSKAVEFRRLLKNPEVKRLRVAAVRCRRNSVLAEVYRVPNADSLPFEFLVVPTNYASNKGDRPSWALNVDEKRTGFCRCCPGTQPYSIADGFR